MRHSKEITPSDSDVFTVPAKIHVGGSGNLHVLTVSGEDVVITGLQTGQETTVFVLKVFDTGTTATLLTAMW
jgi:hypothetical protein